MAAIAYNYFGPINHPATGKLRNALCGAANDFVQNQSGVPTLRYDTVYLLMSSWGGSLEDGFSLYNLMRAVPYKLVTVNMGQIASIANVAFLGGAERYACEHAYFHFHNFDWTYPASTVNRVQMQDHSQLLDVAKANKKAIFKQRTQLSDADFEALNFLEHPVIKDASFAKNKGIIQGIGLPKLPAGTSIFNIDY